MDTNQTLLTSPRVARFAGYFLIMATVFVTLLAIGELRGLFQPRPSAGNIITVDGEGKVTAIPDVATISFTVTQDGVNGSAAQDGAAKKMNVALALVKQAGVADKDIKTTSYSLTPKYAYQPPCYGGYCPQTESRVIGYTASQTVEVKVRKTDDAGKILSDLGDAGVTNLYGPNFTIDDMEGLKAKARGEAIDAARAKAKILARDLGVSLVRVTGFYESGGPIYYGYGKGAAMDSVGAPAPTTPSLPTGENEITINVMVTYEIR